MPAYELDPGDRRLLLARTALLRALGPRLGDVYDFRSCPGVLLALAEMDLAAMKARHASGNAEAVAGVVDAWCDALTRILADKGIALNERRILSDLQVRAREASPEDALDALYDAVVREASAIYKPHWPSCSLEVSKLAERRRPYALCGETRRGKDPVVHLKLNLDALGPATYAAIPSLLVHEAVCHVAAQPDAEVDNDSPFAEGLMHWAAVHFFFARWMATIDGDLRPSAEQHGRSYWHELTESDGYAASPRRLGIRAADRLVEIAETDAELPSESAPAAVAHLAVALNVEPAPLECKDLFVVRIAADDAEARSDTVKVFTRQAEPKVLLH